MKLLLTIFVLSGLLFSPVIFAEDSKQAVKEVTTTAAAESGDKKDGKKDGKKDDKKASEEEPDCD